VLAGDGRGAARLGYWSGNAVLYATVFAGLISFNYLAQGVVIPNAVRTLDPGASAIVTLLSMANPSSICWAIEMVGYGFLGLECGGPGDGAGRGRLRSRPRRALPRRASSGPELRWWRGAR
jgi:hypothetical protein